MSRTLPFPRLKKIHTESAGLTCYSIRPGESAPSANCRWCRCGRDNRRLLPRVRPVRSSIHAWRLQSKYKQCCGLWKKKQKKYCFLRLWWAGCVHVCVSFMSLSLIQHQSSRSCSFCLHSFALLILKVPAGRCLREGSLISPPPSPSSVRVRQRRLQPQHWVSAGMESKEEKKKKNQT